MTAFPTSPAFSSPTPQTGTGVQRLEDFLAAARQLIGAGGETPYNVSAGGAITPTNGTIRVDSIDANPDNLDLIVGTNLPEGSLLLLRPADSGRPITVRHLQAGAGGINLAGAVNYELNQVDQYLFLLRRGAVGAYWFEVARFGREKEHVVGTAGEPAYNGSWVAGTTGVRYRKDAEGRVQMSGYTTHPSLSASSALLFQLSPGYRPAADLRIPIYTSIAAVTEAGYIQVETDGDVRWARFGGVATVNAAMFLDLAGVQFLAAA